nr:unnamed protein product [Spirometra erinaceieuropaei]
MSKCNACEPPTLFHELVFAVSFIGIICHLSVCSNTPGVSPCVSKQILCALFVLSELPQDVDYSGSLDVQQPTER